MAIVVLGMVIAIVTAILGAVCILNFDKGLKPYIQRGAEKKEIQNQQAEIQKENAGAWTIDE